MANPAYPARSPKGALDAVRKMHRPYEMSVLARECVDGACDHDNQKPEGRCGDRLQLPRGEATFFCHLGADHPGPHVSSYDFERITDQVMIDGGRLYEKVQLAITWSRYQASTIEVGRNTPEWIEALSRG